MKNKDEITKRRVATALRQADNDFKFSIRGEVPECVDVFHSEKPKGTTVVIKNRKEDKVDTAYRAYVFLGRAIKYESKKYEFKAGYNKSIAINLIDTLKKQEIEDKNRPHTLTVGDIMVRSSIYTMRKVNFYEVTAIHDEWHVILKEIEWEVESGGWQNGAIVPEKGFFKKGSVPIRARILNKDDRNTVPLKISRCSKGLYEFYQWDGKPEAVWSD